MKRTRFTEEQIIGVLKEAEAGVRRPSGSIRRKGLRSGDDAAAGVLSGPGRRLRSWPCRTSAGAWTLFTTRWLRAGGSGCSISSMM